MYASFQFSLCIAKHGKSLSDGDFIKSAMLAGSDSLWCIITSAQSVYFIARNKAIVGL